MTADDHHGQSREDALQPTPDPATQAAMWDERYSDESRVWSGEPNGALVDELAGVPAGTVLDVGCGEGADAVWLAQQGWDVSALDVSEVALARARQAAADADVQIHWLHSGVVEATLPAAGFDLVSAQYPAVLRTPDNTAERALMAAVAPGGTLLFVHHATFGSQPEAGSAHEHHHHHEGHASAATTDENRVDPTDYVGPADMLSALDDNWIIETNEVRDRRISGGAGAHHHEDVVIKARRLA